jgi:amino-acid N-acetyltransferase
VARKKGLKKLFSLTTRSPHWFIEHGFKQGKTSQLPVQKQRIYNYQRNSLILVKDL